MLPLFQPDLPSVAEILPYLNRMEKNKWYSNFGPLVCEFEANIARHFQIPVSSVISASNATSALTEILRYFSSQCDVNGSSPGYCLLPAWTFVATAQAVVAAGFRPLFCDVDAITGELTPEIAKIALSNNDDILAILPVAPFGAPVDVSIWDNFSKVHSIPVVIDAAASFDALKPGLTPAIVSLHATKSFGIGEGGLLITLDQELAREFRQYTTFGFSDSRKAMSLGGNAKMSEMHAAVGLAQLKRWCDLKERLLEVRSWYDDALLNIEGACSLHNDDVGISNTMNLYLNSTLAVDVIAGLGDAGVSSRSWWEDELHLNPIFGRKVAGPIIEAGKFYEKVIGVPFYSGLSKGDVFRVCNVLGNETTRSVR
ncbi:MAG: DegT/DnrJ/EryC1/StrS family aminotransferase [Halopseudomonas aestusnigri]